EAVFAARGDRIAAFLVEPVRGEGGVHPAPPGYLAHARALCTRYEARLVVDEVQTGLGRTGRMFACEHDGVAPDSITLAKALGGGVVPIGAVLFGADSMTDDFALRHTSTFGGNAFCARVGLHSLDLLTADGQRLVRSVAERGERLRSDLDALAAAHPRVVREVRGRGPPAAGATTRRAAVGVPRPPHRRRQLRELRCWPGLAGLEGTAALRPAEPVPYPGRLSGALRRRLPGHGRVRRHVLRRGLRP